MRLLFDTNVVLAATFSNGRCAELLEHCSLHHELVSSDALIEEYLEKLLRKFRFSPEAAAERVRAFRSQVQTVSPVPLEVPVCRDPDDDLVLATALAGRCAWIITGDKDLLVLGEYAGIGIIAPRDFPEDVAV